MTRTLLLAPLLALASCAPALNLAQGTTGVWTRAGTGALLHNPGTAPFVSVVTRLEGPGLTLERDTCKLSGSDKAANVWHCIEGDVAGGADILYTPKAGKVGRGSVNYYNSTAGGLFRHLELPK